MKLTASQLRYMMALRKLDHGDKDPLYRSGQKNSA